MTNIEPNTKDAHSRQNTMEMRLGAKHSPIHPTFHPRRLSAGTKWIFRKDSLGWKAHPPADKPAHTSHWLMEQMWQPAVLVSRPKPRRIVIQCKNANRLPRPVLGGEVCPSGKPMVLSTSCINPWGWVKERSTPLSTLCASQPQHSWLSHIILISEKTHLAPTQTSLSLESMHTPSSAEQCQNLPCSSERPYQQPRCTTCWRQTYIDPLTGRKHLEKGPSSSLLPLLVSKCKDRSFLGSKRQPQNFISSLTCIKMSLLSSLLHGK